MNTLGFQQDIGGTNACIKRITKDSKGFVQLSSNDTLFTDILFREVKTAEEANAEVVYYYRLVKTNHKVYFLGNLKTINERVSRRVSSCYEYRPNSY